MLTLPWRRSRLSSSGSCNDDDCDNRGGHEHDYDDRGDGDDYSDVHDDGKICAGGRWRRKMTKFQLPLLLRRATMVDSNCAAFEPFRVKIVLNYVVFVFGVVCLCVLFMQ